MLGPYIAHICHHVYHVTRWGDIYEAGVTCISYLPLQWGSHSNFFLPNSVQNGLKRVEMQLLCLWGDISHMWRLSSFGHQSKCMCIFLPFLAKCPVPSGQPKREQRHRINVSHNKVINIVYVIHVYIHVCLKINDPSHISVFGRYCLWFNLFQVC